jgi:XTP/dITP diphosphohydrolase
LLIVLATSPRVAPGLLSWSAWQALRSASVVLAPPGHPQLSALDEAGIGYQVAEEAPADQDGVVVWLPEPGADPPVPPGARLIQASSDLPGAHFIDLVATMDRLRVQCPWDARQTHASLAPHLLEESYEAVEALESGEERALREELGDVLMQPVFHARIAAERGDGSGYTIDDVADGIVAKLVRRHPHVFGDVTVSGADEVKQNWDEIKRREKADLAGRAGTVAAGDAAASVLDGVPFGQPALALAAQLQRRAASAGAPEELARLDGDPGGGDSAAPGGSVPAVPDLGPDLGRDLFRLVAKARELGLDPERELRAAARCYRDLVRAWERSVRTAGS